MKRYYERTEAEQAIIRCAYNFEIWAIETECSDTNPFYDAILEMEDGRAVWEGIDVAVELAYAE